MIVAMYGARTLKTLQCTSTLGAPQVCEALIDIHSAIGLLCPRTVNSYGGSPAIGAVQRKLHLQPAISTAEFGLNIVIPRELSPGVIHSNIHIDFHRLIHRYEQPIIEITATRGNVRYLPSCAAECTPDHIQSGSQKIPLVGSKTRAKSVIYGRFTASGNDCSSSGDVSRETRRCPGESGVCFAYERR